jgi:DNA mismatch repair protein MutS2
LAIEDSLEVGSFRKIATLASTVNFLLNFLRKFDYYPNINARIPSGTGRINMIDDVVDKYGEIKITHRLSY